MLVSAVMLHSHRAAHPIIFRSTLGGRTAVVVTADERWWTCEQQLLTGVRPEPHTNPKALTEHKDGRLMGVGCGGRPFDSDSRYSYFSGNIAVFSSLRVALSPLFYHLELLYHYHIFFRVFGVHECFLKGF